MRAHELGRFLSVSTKRAYELGIPHVKLGRSVRWRRADVVKWVKDRTRSGFSTT